MSSPFQPLKAQATTGRPVKGLTSMPSLGAGEPMQTPSKIGASPHPSSNPKAFSQPPSNKMAGAFTHEQRGGTAPAGVTQGIHSHDVVPHIRMH